MTRAGDVRPAGTITIDGRAVNVWIVRQFADDRDAWRIVRESTLFAGERVVVNLGGRMLFTLAEAWAAVEGAR